MTTARDRIVGKTREQIATEVARVPARDKAKIPGGALRVRFPDGSTALVPDPDVPLIPGPPSLD